MQMLRDELNDVAMNRPELVAIVSITLVLIVALPKIAVNHASQGV